MPEKSITEHLDRLALFCANPDALESLTALRKYLADLEGPLAITGVLEEVQSHRVALADEYIADGKPPQKINWLYSKAIAARIEAAEINQSFDLRHAADMRAIERWRAAVLDRELRQPDHADLCVWLMEQIAEMERQREKYRGDALKLNEIRAALIVERDQARAKLHTYASKIERALGDLTETEAALSVPDIIAVRAGQVLVIAEERDQARAERDGWADASMSESENVARAREQIAVLGVALSEAIAAFVRYEGSVDMDAPPSHRDMMHRLRAALSSTTPPQTGSPTDTELLAVLDRANTTLCELHSLEESDGRDFVLDDGWRNAVAQRSDEIIALYGRLCAATGSPSIPTPSVEAEANRESARAVLARLANEDNWRMVNMESDDQTDYDAMAWSPLDCAMGEDGRVSDPLFHKPWKLAAFALSALPICDTPTERVTLAGLPDLGLSADQVIAKQEFE